MQLTIQQRRPGHVPLGVFLMAPLFFLPLGAWLVERGFIHFGTCGSKVVLGIPCMTCGATRATIHLLHGDVAAALALQPLVILTYGVLLAWGLTSLTTFLMGKRVRLRLGKKTDLGLKIALVVLPFANWAYLIWAGV